MCWTDFYTFYLNFFLVLMLWRLFHWPVQIFWDENRLIFSKASLISLPQYCLPIFILAKVNKPILCCYELYWKRIYNKLVVVKNPLFTFLKHQQIQLNFYFGRQICGLEKKCSWIRICPSSKLITWLTQKMYSTWTAHIPMYCYKEDSWKMTRFFIIGLQIHRKKLKIN